MIELTLARGALALSVLAACSGAEPARSPAEPPRAPAVVAREVVFTGMCDASGAVPLSPTRFVVADDEDSVLRVYDADRGGAPLAVHDVAPALRLPLRGAAAPGLAETDLEGATRLGDRAFWITSHGRASDGDERPERMRLFATNVPRAGEPITVAGVVYEDLLEDLASAPQLVRYDLARAARLAPKAPGGLNVEGLTEWGGALLIGLRSPVPGGRAVIVPLDNGAALADGRAARAAFGEPMELDLGGQGVRALSTWRGRLLIAAGNPGNGGRSRLFVQRGAAPPAQVDLDLHTYNPEGFFTPEERDEIMILSDDGTVMVDGAPCKLGTDPARKSFRGLWLALGS
jgi:hypothetical protein